MGVILLVIYLKSGRVPFLYDSWLIYGEILVASVLNMAGYNLFTIAN